jgi:opacity protein-like surface antigen
VFATPAAARDGSGYVGVDLGVLFPKKQTINASTTFTNTAIGPIATQRYATYKLKTGYDADINAGYDFGMFRVEGEVAYKHAKASTNNFNQTFVTAFNPVTGYTYTTTTIGPAFPIGGHASVLSGMINGLADFGGENSVGGYLGGGIGYARVHEFGGSQSKFAWQILAGVYTPISSNIDVGLKYRYFRTGQLHFASAETFVPGAVTCGNLPCTGGTVFFTNGTHWQSHSLMLNLTYNFGAAVAPPPPPPPPPPPAVVAPATQTCPDGSVILATSVCPAPPPPPPPPPPPQRGERGQ